MRSRTRARPSLPLPVPPAIWKTNHAAENVRLHAEASVCLGLTL